jgi:hypothetical protein
MSSHVAIEIPVKLITEFMKEFKDLLLSKPKTKAVYPLENHPKQGSHKLLLFDEKLSLDSMPENLHKFLEA